MQGGEGGARRAGLVVLGFCLVGLVLLAVVDRDRANRLEPAVSVRWRRSPRAVGRAFADDAVLLQLDRQRYHGLDRVGARLWERLERPATLEELVGELGGSYDADAATLAADLAQFLGELEREGLVERIVG